MDFFVCLLYGHVVVVLGALATLASSAADISVVATAATVLLALIPVWYRSAVVATDEWAGRRTRPDQCRTLSTRRLLLASASPRSWPPNARCGPWSRACHASPTTNAQPPWTASAASPRPAQVTRTPLYEMCVDPTPEGPAWSVGGARTR
ncbi:hypothetical protein ACRAWF_03000 [Streptomyces sp. L7]